MSRDRAIEGCELLVQEIIARQQANRAAKPQIKLSDGDGIDDEGRRINEAQLDHDDYLSELGMTNADYREWTRS